MPNTLEETREKSVAENAEPKNAEPKRDAKWYSDQDPTLYPETVAHLLTPKRRRTVVTTETFASIRAACDQH